MKRSKLPLTWRFAAEPEKSRRSPCDTSPPNYVQQQMGHASIELTMDLYGHLYREANAHRYVDELPGPGAPLGHSKTEEAE